MHRLKLTWRGSEGSIAETTATFRILFISTVIFAITNNVLKYLPLFFVDAYGNPTAEYVDLVSFRLLLLLAYWAVTAILVARTRKHIRAKYSIPEEYCKGSEDCCASCWCYCCAVSQMARHTADYENYAATCCSETGLSPNAPAIV